MEGNLFDFDLLKLIKLFLDANFHRTSNFRKQCHWHLVL